METASGESRLENLYRKEMPQHQSGADLQTKRIYKEVQL
jgi:hypothetical protein